jgi:hypothetical protein
MGGGEQRDDPLRGYTGNIDLSKRPIIFNDDGTASTEKSFSISEKGNEILLPKIVNGIEVSQKEAIKHYHKTGEHLGVYPSIDAANSVAERIHNRRHVMIPETGAAKYWYVDPRAEQYNPMEQGQVFAPTGPSPRGGMDALGRIIELMDKRIGVSPEQEPRF